MFYCHPRRFGAVCVLAVLLVPAFAHSAEGPAAEDVAFVASCDQSTQRYLLIRPEGFSAEVPHDLLIVLHGHGSDRWQVLGQSRQEFRAALDAAAARKMLVVSPDYRAKVSWMGPKAEADLLQIIGELKAKFRIGKVIVSGASMGGSSALTFTALHPDLVDGVVSLNGTANHLEFEKFQDAIKNSFGGSKSEIPLEYKNRSAEYWPERFKMPVAIAAGGADKAVPPASVLRLASTIKKLHPDNVLVIFSESGGHRTSYADSKSAYEFVLDKAISRAERQRN